MKLYSPDITKPTEVNYYWHEKVLIEPMPKPKQGEWETEYHGNGWNDYWDYTCSNCDKKYERADAVLYKANFCPNCGARMKGVDDEISCR